MSLLTPGKRPRSLPSEFGDLVGVMPPRAIMDDTQYEDVLDMIDQLMRIRRLSRGQAAYLETLVQLVQAYEASRHAIDTSGITGLDALKHLVAENHMTAADLAMVLGVHVSMGSKILKGERALTVGHVKALAARFKVSPEVFLD
ncbi:MAG TPA: helix-turn-helix domain-containing protein [Phycisphaerae bacterium]|nr:helix-turn-helix domain-containing protein [Phycisphaerae bacterium]